VIRTAQQIKRRRRILRLNNQTAMREHPEELRFKLGISFIRNFRPRASPSPMPVPAKSGLEERVGEMSLDYVLLRTGNLRGLIALVLFAARAG
jgi:hypothetical protein